MKDFYEKKIVYFIVYKKDLNFKKLFLQNLEIANRYLINNLFLERIGKKYFFKKNLPKLFLIKDDFFRLGKKECLEELCQNSKLKQICIFCVIYYQFISFFLSVLVQENDLKIYERKT